MTLPQKKFQKENPDHKICATFRLKNDTLDFAQRDKEKLVKIINQFVCETINGNYQNQPDFIEEIVIMTNEVVSFSYLENNCRGKTLTILEVQNAISAKEKKLE